MTYYTPILVARVHALLCYSGRMPIFCDFRTRSVLLLHASPLVLLNQHTIHRRE